MRIIASQTTSSNICSQLGKVKIISTSITRKNRDNRLHTSNIRPKLRCRPKFPLTIGKSHNPIMKNHLLGSTPIIKEQQTKLTNIKKTIKWATNINVNSQKVNPNNED